MAELTCRASFSSLSASQKAQRGEQGRSPDEKTRGDIGLLEMKAIGSIGHGLSRSRSKSMSTSRTFTASFDFAGKARVAVFSSSDSDIFSLFSFSSSLGGVIGFREKPLSSSRK